jgi:hypothetical protein
MNVILYEKIAYISLITSLLPFGQRCIRIKRGAELNDLPLYLNDSMSVREFRYKIHNYLNVIIGIIIC